MLKKLILGASALAVPAVTFAQTAAPTLDTSGVTDFLTDQVLPGLAAVGGIWLILSALSGGYSWIKGMSSGK